MMGQVGISYSNPDVWTALADRLSRQHVPEPMGGFGYVRCEPRWTWRPKLRDFDLWFVLDGRGRGRIANTSYDLRPGTLLVLRPGDAGDLHHDPAAGLTVAYTHFDFFDAGSRRVHRPAEEWLPSRRINVTDIARMGELVSNVVRLRRDPHPLRRLEAGGAFWSVLAEVYRQDAQAHGHPLHTLDPRLGRVVEAIQYQPGIRLSLREAADLAGLSPAYFSRLFRSNTGLSFREFLMETRLARAYHLLAETTMTVSEIARALGYADEFLFSRQFRRRYGQSPSHVRSTSALDDSVQ